MITSPLTVTVSSDGRVCLLAATGELDFTNVARFALCAASALEDGPERMMFDLAGLEFLDGAGARVLMTAAEAAPPGCPVAVRSVSLFAARVLEMLGLDLECPPDGTATESPAGPGLQAGPDLPPGPDSLLGPGLWPPARPVPVLPGSDPPARVIDLDLARNRRRMIRAAQQIAVTEERIAATLARLATQSPDRADQFTAVSRSARGYASRSRQWVRDHQALAGTGTPPEPAEAAHRRHHRGAGRGGA